jgi:hypothetical protein
MVEVSQQKIVTVDKMSGGHKVWVGMSRGQFVGERNVKAPRGRIWLLKLWVVVFFNLHLFLTKHIIIVSS